MEASIMSPGGEETVKVAGGFDEVITEREHEHEVALVFGGDRTVFHFKAQRSCWYDKGPWQKSRLLKGRRLFCFAVEDGIIPFPWLFLLYRTDRICFVLRRGARIL